MPTEARPARALVTGCAGFIGSHLVERLLEEGWSVVGADCFTDFYSRDIKESNVARALADPRFELVEADLARDPVEPLIEDVEVVFHLAAQAGVRQSFGDGFAGYLHHNLLATQRLLEASAGQSLRSFVYASSSSVYGNGHSGATAEDADCRPESPYGMTKLAVEALAGVYQRCHGVPTVGLRYFTVYGPRQRPDMAFNRFLARASERRPLTVFGTGEQTRDFTYVADAVEGTMAAAHHGRPGTAYNIGGGTPVTLGSVIEEIGLLLGRPVGVEYTAPMQGDVYSTCADGALARRDLGFAPQTPLRAGLADQLIWARGQAASAPVIARVAA